MYGFKERERERERGWGGIELVSLLQPHDLTETNSQRQVPKAAKNTGIKHWYVATNGAPEWQWLHENLGKEMFGWLKENNDGKNILIPRFTGEGTTLTSPLDVAIVEQTICSLAYHFFGTFKSSFSLTVHELRRFQVFEHPSEAGLRQETLPDLLSPLVPLKGGYAG